MIVAAPSNLQTTRHDHARRRWRWHPRSPQASAQHSTAQRTHERHTQTELISLRSHRHSFPLALAVVLLARAAASDLDKCLRALKESGALSAEPGNGRDAATVLILGAFGGLWDREMSNFHVALKHAVPGPGPDSGPGINSILVGDHSIAHVLLPGWNKIDLDPGESPPLLRIPPTPTPAIPLSVLC